VSGTYLRERVVGYQATILATEWGIRHDRQIVLRTPSQKVTLNTSLVEAARNPIGRTAIAVWDAEESFHLASAEVGDAPRSDFSRRA
jgi:hypothetical protein